MTPDHYVPGDYNVLCAECGRKRKARDMQKHWQGYWVCPRHWETRQPQDYARSIKDIITPPWTQPPPLPFALEPTVPDVRPPLDWPLPPGYHAGSYYASQQIAMQGVGTGGGAGGGSGVPWTLYYNCTAWLTQCYSVIPNTDVIAQLGANGITGNSGFTLDAVVTFNGSSTIYGRWATPAAGLACPVATADWKFEFFVRFKVTDNSGYFIGLYPTGSGVGAYKWEGSWGISSIGSVLQGSVNTNFQASGGAINNTMPRPLVDTWYHCCFQQGVNTKEMTFFLDGYVRWTNSGGTVPWSAGTALTATFGYAAGVGSDNNWGGVTLGIGCPLYPVTALNTLAFTPPTARFDIH